MNEVKISKAQRRIIIVTILISFFAIVFWRFKDVTPGGKYSVSVVPEYSPQESLQGTAEIIFNEDIGNGNYYFQKISLKNGTTITFYGESKPLKFNKQNVVIDDNLRIWRVHIGERIDQLGYWEKLFIILPNLLYWCVIIFLFSVNGFMEDIIAILEVKKEKAQSLNRVDHWAYHLGERLEKWKDTIRNKNLISDICKFVGIVLAILWFLREYKII